MIPRTIVGPVVAASPLRCLLGEGPVWLPATGELLYVDIFGGDVHWFDPATSTTRTRHIDPSSAIGALGHVGAAVPTTQGGLVLAVDNVLRLVDADGSTQQTWVVEADRPSNRFNDCGTDPSGRLWAGTMSRTHDPGTAAVWRLGSQGTIDVGIPRTTLSNGIGWSPDGTVMYFIDSTTQRVDAFAYDLEHGTVSARRPFATIDAGDGLPDGLAVDAEGGVWVALAGGGALRRWRPDGTLDLVVTLPVSHPTSLAFGGEDLTTLFITTSSFTLDADGLAAEPLAGALLAMPIGHSGLVSPPYRAVRPTNASMSADERRP